MASSDIAIRCADVWKSYRIYHQRSHTLKERILTRRNSYEEFWALRDVTFDVPTGTTLGIIGSNGSGKSTLLKVMARILTPNRGQLTTVGTMSSLLELGTGFHPELTGRENVFLAGSLQGQKKAAIERRYDSIVDFAGIERFMDLPVKNYSSGMYARLAFAVAISVEPDILLIDEVLSVGDEQFQLKCYERIAQFRAQGRTIVLVSHSLDSIRSLCGDAVWLEKGELRGLGPAHRVVADYLGQVHAERMEQAGNVGVASSADRWGNGAAEIVEMSLLDRHGHASGAFRTGDAMTFRIRYRAEHPIEAAACGIAIYRSDTLAHIYGQNTDNAGVALRLDGDGVIEFVLPTLPLLKGGYVVTVALHDPSVKQVYDWHERQYSFLVFEDPELPVEAGMVALRGTWRVRQTEGVSV